MIRAVTMYQVLCDRCKATDTDSDFFAWVTADQAVDIAVESEWLAMGERHYCPACVEWDEDADALVPKKLEATA